MALVLVIVLLFEILTFNTHDETTLTGKSQACLPIPRSKSFSEANSDKHQGHNKRTRKKSHVVE
jgi:hypothetical protein